MESATIVISNADPVPTKPKIVLLAPIPIEIPTTIVYVQ